MNLQIRTAPSMTFWLAVTFYVNISFLMQVIAGGVASNDAGWAVIFYGLIFGPLYVLIWMAFSIVSFICRPLIRFSSVLLFCVFATQITSVLFTVSGYEHSGCPLIQRVFQSDCQGQNRWISNEIYYFSLIIYIVAIVIFLGHLLLVSQKIQRENS